MRLLQFVILFLLILVPVSKVSALSEKNSADVAQLTTLIFLPQAQEIELALSAGPEHLRSEATVYVFGKNGYEKIRSGKNGFTCMVNRDGNQAGDNDLKPTCWDAEGSATIVPVMLRVGQLLAERRTADEIKRDIEAGFSQGRFASPRKTGIAYMLRGDVQYNPKTKKTSRTLFPPHYMIYAPGVTNEDIGMNMDAYKKHPSLPLVYAGYSGGARTAYIIVIAAQDKHTLINSGLRAQQVGWYWVRTKGSHHQYKHPTKPGVVTVPGNRGKDMAVGTLNNILKQAGLKP